MQCTGMNRKFQEAKKAAYDLHDKYMAARLAAGQADARLKRAAVAHAHAKAEYDKLAEVERVASKKLTWAMKERDRLEKQ